MNVEDKIDYTTRITFIQHNKYITLDMHPRQSFPMYNVDINYMLVNRNWQSQT